MRKVEFQSRVKFDVEFCLIKDQVLAVLRFKLVFHPDWAPDCLLCSLSVAWDLAVEKPESFAEVISGEDRQRGGLGKHADVPGQDLGWKNDSQV